MKRTSSPLSPFHPLPASGSGQPPASSPSTGTQALVMAARGRPTSAAARRHADPANPAGSAATLETAIEQTHEAIGRHAVAVVRGQSQLQRTRQKMQQHEAKAQAAQTETPASLQAANQQRALAEELRQTLDATDQLPLPCPSSAALTARQSDQAYCNAVLAVHRATLARMHLPQTVAALLNPTPEQLNLARQEVLWLASQSPAPEGSIQLLDQLLRMAPWTGFTLPAQSIPPGIAGVRLCSVLTQVYRSQGVQRPPLTVQGKLPASIKPAYLPLSGTPPTSIPVPQHAPDMNRPVKLARSLADAVQTGQKALLAPAQTLQLKRLRQQTKTIEQQARERDLDAALSQARLLKSTTGGSVSDPRVAHGEAAQLLVALITEDGTRLPHTQAALQTHPPQPDLLERARQEVLWTLVGDEQPGLCALLNCLLRIDPDTPMHLDMGRMPPGDFWTDDVLESLQLAWPAQGAPRLRLTFDGRIRDDGLDGTQLDLGQLFLQPGLRQLTIVGFHMNEEQLDRLLSQLPQQGSDLESLSWLQLPIEWLNHPGTVALVQALPSLHTIQLEIVDDFPDEKDDPDEENNVAPIRSPISPELALALAVKPLQSLSIELCREDETERLPLLLNTLITAMRTQPAGVNWQHVRLSAWCMWRGTEALVCEWVTGLVASPAVRHISLDLEQFPSALPADQQITYAQGLQVALLTRQTPLTLTLGISQPVHLNGLLDPFLVPVTDGTTVAEPVLAPCIQTLTLNCATTIVDIYRLGNAVDKNLTPELMGLVTASLPRMPDLQQLTLELRSADEPPDAPPVFTATELSALTDAVRAQPKLQIHVAGDSWHSRELRRAIERPWLEKIAWNANARGLQVAIAPHLPMWVPEEVFGEIARHAEQDEPTGRTFRRVPMLNRAQLLATVDTFDELVAIYNQGAHRPGQPTLTLRHPLQAVADRVRENQQRETQST